VTRITRKECDESITNHASNLTGPHERSCRALFPSSPANNDDAMQHATGGRPRFRVARARPFLFCFCARRNTWSDV